MGLLHGFLRFLNGDLWVILQNQSKKMANLISFICGWLASLFDHRLVLSLSYILLQLVPHLIADCVAFSSVTIVILDRVGCGNACIQYIRSPLTGAWSSHSPTEVNCFFFLLLPLECELTVFYGISCSSLNLRYSVTLSWF